MRFGTTLVLFCAAASSFQSWRPLGQRVARYEPQVNWSYGEALAWITSQLLAGEASAMLIPLNSYAPAVAVGLRHLPHVMGRELKLEVRKVATGDAGPLDGALKAGWEGLAIPILNPLAAPEADVETVLSSAAREDKGPAPEEVVSDAAAFVSALTAMGAPPKPAEAPAPAGVDPVEPVAPIDAPWAKLKRPRKGTPAELALASIEREAVTSGLTWDKAAYLAWLAPLIRGDLPHSTWGPLLHEAGLLTPAIGAGSGQLKDDLNNEADDDGLTGED